MVIGKMMPEDEFGRRKGLRLVPGDAKAPMQLEQRKASGPFPIQLQISGRSSSHRERQPTGDKQRRSGIYEIDQGFASCPGCCELCANPVGL